MTFRFGAAAICALLTNPALAQQPQHTAMPGMTGSQSPASQAMTDGMAKMNQAMTSAPMNGDADHDFVSMMIPHHQGAIDMAKIELQKGHDPAIRRLAQAVVAAQEKEIAEMRRWLSQHSPH